MSRIARIEIPGVFHLVEQRLRRGLSARSQYHERGMSLIILRSCLKEHKVALCGYNFLSRRTLLVLTPARSGAIGHALTCADRTFALFYQLYHHRFTPLWESPFSSCPFADEVAWSVLRYVDLASAPNNPLPPNCRALNSADDHAGDGMGALTAPRDRLPHAEHWRTWLESPRDKLLVQALEMCLRTGKPFGPFPFVRQVEQQCHRRLRPACLTWPGLFDSLR